MYNDKESLKEKLKDIINIDYEVPKDIDKMEFTNMLLSNIGDNDPELRDDLIYMVLGNWVIKEYFTPEEKRYILDRILSEDHIFYRVGNCDDDTVFTRSFSVLLLPLLIGTHNEIPYLSIEEVTTIKNKLIEYSNTEKDLRGYIPGKGWAHSAAHTADAFDELARCKEMDKNDLQDILVAIYSKLFINNYLYYNGEDERMTTAVITVLKRESLEMSAIEDWINRFTDLETTGDLSIDHIKKSNAKNFLRSIYFRILDDEELSKYIPLLKKVLDNKVLN